MECPECAHAQHLVNENVRLLAEIGELAKSILKLKDKIIELETKMYDMEKALNLKVGGY